jgi:hypothetical protein
MTFQILNDTQLPRWLGKYPAEYLNLVDQDIVMFRPWNLLNEKLLVLRNSELPKRFPNRQLFAFAARLDNDDVACWEANKPGSVVIVHDFSSEQFADRGEYQSFWDWFRAAIDDMIAFDS